MRRIEVIVNDRLGTKVRVKCSPDDTIADLKKFIAAKIGRRWRKIQLKRCQYNILKDKISLEEYEIHNGTSLDLYYK